MKNAAPPEKIIGAGKSLQTRRQRIFKRGSLMFIEGETSTSMFIIRTGKVRIIKQQGEHSVELAVLGAGSVLGELALLDHQPRSATAQVIEDTVVTVIDEHLLSQTLQTIPPWLAGVIRLVVQRLRDTMKRTTDDMVNKSVGGVLKIILTLASAQGEQKEGGIALPLTSAKKKIGEVIGIGDMETENVFLHLILKEMVFIRKSSDGEEYLLLKDKVVLQQYMNFLRARRRGIDLPGENLDESSFELINYILEAGEKHGKPIAGQVHKVGIHQVSLAQSSSGKSRHIDPDALDRLIKNKIVKSETEKIQSAHGMHQNHLLLYNKQVLLKMKYLQTWLPIFREEIRF